MTLTQMEMKIPRWQSLKAGLISENWILTTRLNNYSTNEPIKPLNIPDNHIWCYFGIPTGIPVTRTHPHFGWKLLHRQAYRTTKLKNHKWSRDPDLLAHDGSLTLKPSPLMVWLVLNRILTFSEKVWIGCGIWRPQKRSPSLSQSLRLALNLMICEKKEDTQSTYFYNKFDQMCLTMM